MNDLTEKALHAAEQCMSDVYEYYKNGVSNTVMDEAMKSLKNDGLKLVKQARAALTPPAAVSAAGAAGWVSVTDRLPETRDDYSRLLLCYGEGGIDGPWFVAYYCASMGTWYLARDNQPRMTVTHWQPRPAAPAPAAPTTTAPQS